MPIIQVDWDKFEFRCHYLGDLMSEPKGKSNAEKYSELKSYKSSLFEKISAMNDGKLKDNAFIKFSETDKKLKELEPIKDVPLFSSTCLRRLAQIYTEQTTGRRKKIESFYIEKGLKTEELSISLYSSVYEKFYRKNKERISNGFVIGEIDFDDEKEDIVIDTKSSFDIFTFDETIATGTKKLYYWQGQGYMWLKNRKHFRLAYCLNNTPSEIIFRLKNNLKYKFIGSPEEYEDACREIDELHNYDDLPEKRKIRVYDIERNDEDINRLKTAIPHFREYLKNFDKNKTEEYENQD